ncbi:unnamed protein product [marine sediment metagenome]|uniref:Uncharacterized protein n=1 Tax=marine sediment metagenome TaxID=412755 RepID=X1K4U3_9ZZZZ
MQPPEWQAKRMPCPNSSISSAEKGDNSRLKEPNYFIYPNDPPHYNTA